jgi:hypothetical protein
MPKKLVRNTLSQPIYVNLVGGGSLKIPARTALEVDAAALQSPEMLFHQSQGNVIVRDLPDAEPPAQEREERN